jgi:DNA-binding transcriptional regulator LsrR (DeoR family)
MYFQEGLTQAQVASKLGYSRSMVSRLLTEAREQRVVEIRIRHPLERRLDLEQALQKQFDLVAVRVLARGTLSYGSMLRRLGTLAAGLLLESVEDNMTLGVSWGTGVAETVSALYARRTGPHVGIQVVQIIGSLGTSDPEIDGPELARRLARTLGGRYTILPAPLFVDSEETRSALLADQRVRHVLDLARRIEVALVGIGSSEPESSSLMRAGYFTAAQVSELAQAGAVGDVCALHFDRWGQPVETPLTRRLVGIDRSSLTAIPTRLGVAGGQAKALPIVGACRAKYVNVLVTDEMAALGTLRAAAEE